MKTPTKISGRIKGWGATAFLHFTHQISSIYAIALLPLAVAVFPKFARSFSPALALVRSQKQRNHGMA